MPNTNCQEPWEARMDSLIAAIDVPTSPLRRLCRRTAARLRRRYARANSMEHQLPAAMWLCDNYYVIARVAKELDETLRRASHGHKKTAALLFAAAQTVFGTLRPPVTDDTAISFLQALSVHIQLGEVAFALLAEAVKAALLRLCDTDDEEQIAYAVAGFSALQEWDSEKILRACSGVECLLRQDPAGIYPIMTAESRRQYHHLVARLAAHHGRGEEETAARILARARAHAATAVNPADDPLCHVGSGLVDSPLIINPRRRRGVLSLVWQTVLPVLLAGLFGWWCGQLWLGLLFILPLWEILRPMIGELFLRGTTPDFLPRIDCRKLPANPKTVVLVSTLLPRTQNLPELRTRMEQLYFSNPDENLYYCILVDMGEHDYPVDEQDASRTEAAKQLVEELNACYPGRFLLFLRCRTYSKTQNRYSGWERKRGAITEFVRFLHGQPSTALFVGDKALCGQIRYLLALDADTNLLYESARQLVGTAMHPLNRPVPDKHGVAARGYGILLPKITTDLASAKATAFSRVLSGCGGITAYDTGARDYYQDLFGRSIFSGKGLIDVESFYAALDCRFPENQILSHDILEGAYLRCGFVGDVELTDKAPPSLLSWLARLHRWTRGDWQNLLFLRHRYRLHGKIWENPIGFLSRFQLFDNLRRSLTPAAALLCLLAALLIPDARTAALLGWVGVLAVSFPTLWAAAHALLSGGVFTLSRKFFTRTLPHTMELCARALLFVIMLPAQALLGLDAAWRALWRTFVSRRSLLAWTTAAQSDARRTGLAGAAARLWLPELIGVLFFLCAKSPALSLTGVLFALVLPAAVLTARPTGDNAPVLSEQDRDTLLSYNAAMWRYYEDFATDAHNYLPPDNIQQSPVYRVAARTSPTNIGLMFLACLAAWDMGFIDAQGLLRRVARTLDTTEKLKTWRGNLYNWYDTATLAVLPPSFVSFVDSGNFLCCLVALKEGMRALAPRYPAARDLIARVEGIIARCDLTAFYDPRKKLFAIGWDTESSELSPSRYDFLMSEARLTSYYAIAKKQVRKKHWGALSRTMSRNGRYAGPVSWTGTMFEYFMPHLLLPVPEGSLIGEALTYCLYCQKKWARTGDLPWGVSESAFFAFDNNLNYQYKAHGVQKLGVKRHLERETVIAPYATFLTLSLNPHSALENLRRLRALGVYGRYGFFEAVDFTPNRVGNGALAVTRSYMTHHIGMSMAASANILYENCMQRRFMADKEMRSAEELLQEKIAKDVIVYDHLKTTDPRREREERPGRQGSSPRIHPADPKVTLLSNGELTDILTDTGAGHLRFGHADITRRSADLLEQPQGFVALAGFSGGVLPATAAPFYTDDTYTVETAAVGNGQSVLYTAARQELELRMRCTVHPTISCARRQISLKNHAPRREEVSLLLYCEPVLSAYNHYSAHPAYAKLFVPAEYDSQHRALIFHRRNRDSTESPFLLVGFAEADINFTWETRREALLTAPDGVRGLWAHCGKALANHSGGVPDACCALSLSMTLPPGGSGQCTLLLCAAHSRAEGIDNLITLRNTAAQAPNQMPAAQSPLPAASAAGQLAHALLGKLLYAAGAVPSAAAMRENVLGQRDLWALGISGDDPIILLEQPRNMEDAVLQAYLHLHRQLRAVHLGFDLVVLWETEEEKAHLTALARAVGGRLMLGTRTGIHLLEKAALAPPMQNLLRAVARHSDSDAPEEATSAEKYRPVRFLPLLPAALPEKPDLTVQGGVFAGGAFHADKHSPLPWCHVLANPVFGTLVSDRAAGYTWAGNSRENKLTPWGNDAAADNTGERCLLQISQMGHEFYDLINGARASFSNKAARYSGTAGGISSRVSISVPPRGMAKYIDLVLINHSDRPQTVRCAYYTEPVLGVNRDTARHIVPQIREADTAGGAVLLLSNPYTAIAGYAALGLQIPGGAPTASWFGTDRCAFLGGQWDKQPVAPAADLCAAVIAAPVLPPRQEVRLRFVLGYGRTAKAAADIVRRPPPAPVPTAENAYRISTPDEALNQFINHFAPHQILSARLYGRCGFYQCGGAYGFRDQLQDVMSYVLLRPDMARRHIIRCCCAQFEEGDVLHWWHNLPARAGGLRGVRTTFSDDLLWLPLAVAEYVRKTGDSSLLAVPCRYLQASLLAPGEHEKYIAPQKSPLREDVYRHCVRALEHGWQLDERGLPLMGSGDWNDGFSAVGIGGRGTSVWLALFMAVVYTNFAETAEIYRDTATAALCRTRRAQLLTAVDTHAWDGRWYARAFYDDGSAMGVADSAECRIDLLPQSFGVLAGLPDRERLDCALNQCWEQLVDERLQVVKLFTPPFQSGRQRPGYVRAYPAGLRENGGQYTHAAVWFAMALLRHGAHDRGWQILQMLNPVHRCRDEALARAYRLEPYAMAADIYTHPAAEGRGGWSQYTGAASWYYRVVLEELLGLQLCSDALHINPRLPDSWDNVTVTARISGTDVTIQMRRGETPVLQCDGVDCSAVPLDGGAHEVFLVYTANH